MVKEQDKLLYAKINLETAQISWKEIERFFASGKVIYVADHIDMIDVAKKMADDDVVAIQKLLEQKVIERLTDDKALQWATNNPTLWSVVVKPWILVQQERGDKREFLS